MIKSLGLLLLGVAASGAAAGLPEKVYTVSALEFVATDNVSVMRSSGIRRYPVADESLTRTAMAPVHLPDGAEITRYELQYCSLNPKVGTVQLDLREQCQSEDDCFIPPSYQPGIHTPYAVYGCPLRQEAFELHAPVNNTTRIYYLEASFIGDVGAVELTAIRVYYRMKTAAPPDNGRFDDVPRDHPFYQFIEALAASGITNGCAPAKFCPDATVTRGQFAALLSRARPRLYHPVAHKGPAVCRNVRGPSPGATRCSARTNSPYCAETSSSNNR